MTQMLQLKGRPYVLLPLAESKRRLAGAGFGKVQSRYIHVFPWRGALWQRMERMLALSWNVGTTTR